MDPWRVGKDLKKKKKTYSAASHLTPQLAPPDKQTWASGTLNDVPTKPSSKRQQEESILSDTMLLPFFNSFIETKICV